MTPVSHIIAIIEAVHAQTQFLPTLRQCRERGMHCGYGRFFHIRGKWAALQNPEPETASRFKPLAPEAIKSAVSRVEPIEELTMTQRAIREYRVASRRVGLSGARATK